MGHLISQQSRRTAANETAKPVLSNDTDSGGTNRDARHRSYRRSDQMGMLGHPMQANFVLFALVRRERKSYSREALRANCGEQRTGEADVR